MTTYTITTPVNIDSLAAKAGGDTYTINGGDLTIDQDSRYGLNQSVTAALGAMTISSTLGGSVLIDGRYVRLIPFNSGSGNVPAANTVISQVGITGKLIGVWGAINVAPTAPGAAMPTSGFIKVKQVSQIPGYSAGALTGIGATATGEDVAGWLEIVADESKTATIPRLGSFAVEGAFFDVGTTTGTNTDSYQLPTSGSAFYGAGVWVSKTSTPTTDADYEIYVCAGTLTAAASVGTDELRGKVCWISTAGVLRFGHDGTNADTGYCPPAGRKIRIPNVVLQNCTTAARGVNALPNATLATRYDLTTTSGGEITINNALCNWYPSLTSAFSVAMRDTAIAEQLYLYTIAAPIYLTRVGVGQCSANTQRALQLQYCFQGGVFTDCVWSRATATDTITYKYICNHFTYVREKSFALTVRAAASGFGDLTRSCNDITYVNPTLGSIPCSWEVGSKLRATDVVYFDRITGETTTVNPMNAVRLQGQDIQVDGISFGGVSNVHPYSPMVLLSGNASQNIVIQNIGSFNSKLDMGSANACAGVLETAGSSGISGVKLRRCYISNNRAATPFGVVDPTNTDFSIENCIGTYTDASIIKQNGLRAKGLGATPALTFYSGVYGTHWLDGFSSLTAGWITLRFYEPDTVSAPYVTLSGGAAFTGGGELSMPTIGMSAIFEMDYFALGHLDFANAAPVLTGGTIANYSVEYQIDKNDGFGWSGSWAALSAANLSAETGIDASKGVKLQVRITTTTTNTSAFTALTITTDTSSAAQQYLYPMEVATIVVDGLILGSMVKASKVSDGSILFTGVESSGAVSFTTDYVGAVAIEARKASSAPYYRPWASQITTVLGSTSAATATQQLDE